MTYWAWLLNAVGVQCPLFSKCRWRSMSAHTSTGNAKAPGRHRERQGARPSVANAKTSGRHRECQGARTGAVNAKGVRTTKGRVGELASLPCLFRPMNHNPNGVAPRTGAGGNKRQGHRRHDSPAQLIRGVASQVRPSSAEPRRHNSPAQRAGFFKSQRMRAESPVQKHRHKNTPAQKTPAFPCRRAVGAPPAGPEQRHSHFYTISQ
jgi:hypothetical protein